jgi:anti-sigma28 factor (negative regulator of flagellin synthesis)
MTCNGEFESGLMVTERNDQDALMGMQQVSQVRLTHREDGSLVSPELVLKETVLEAPAERVERLRVLKAAIESGQYFVSSHDVAERLMRSMMRN